jgi:hypothetical protein
MKRLWQQNILQEANFSQILRTLAGPFHKAEGRFRYARRFFVSEKGSNTLTLWCRFLVLTKAGVDFSAVAKKGGS